MKILHTADWHLGKRLDRFSRLEEQVLVLNEIIDIANTAQVDMVIIAGDLFDNFNPSVEAIELFYKTLKQLSNNGKRPVLAIAGNHDSPNLIDAPNALARECGIILIGHPLSVVQPLSLENFKITKSEEGFIEITISSYEYPLRIIHTAYANEVRLKQYFGEDKEKGLNDSLAQHWQTIADTYCDNQGVNLLVTHLYINNPSSTLLEEPDGEKPLKIGNADLLYSSAIPQQIQYTALGHLHAFNNIGSPETPIVYSSSPLCYSFSEAGQTKYVAIIEVEPNQIATYHKIALTQGRKLVRKTFDNIDNALHWLENNPYTLVELSIESDTYLRAEDRQSLYQSHDGIVHLIPKIKQNSATQKETQQIDITKDLDALFIDFFEAKNNHQKPNEDLMQLLQEIKGN